MMTLSRRAFWPLLALLAVLAAAGAGGMAWHLSQKSLEERLDRALGLTARTIAAEIERFRYLPELTLEDPRIRAAITWPKSDAAILAANRALARAAQHSGASDLYLLNAEGTAIAASNWQAENSFIGVNYAFRPYFSDALSRGNGRFYGVGVTTGEPGYFLSSHTVINGKDAVMVAKVDLRPLQTGWSDADGTLAVADRFGVVFLSGAENWLYRPLFPLPPGRAEEITAARAFASLPVTERAPVLQGQDQTRVLRVDGMALLRQQALPRDSWTLVISAPLAPVHQAMLLTVGAALVTALALGALTQIYLQRRHLIAMRLRQNAMLESRVVKRTAALMREIDERRRTEADLRAARDALIHSEKMAALGRMSAAIVHEISQPLAAMEATLAAALLSGKAEDEFVASRIEKARSHIRRILRTIRHLKSFSRKDSGTLGPVSVDAALRNAIDLVAPRASDVGIEIAFAPEGDSPVIRVGQVRLEQVLVNLLVNALDAVEGVTSPAITLSRTLREGQVEIAVTDNGAGIPPSLISRVMEPFFSTKTSGESLGLGLSISRSIVEEFGGSLTLTEAVGGGTCAALIFEAQTEDRMVAE